MPPLHSLVPIPLSFFPGLRFTAARAFAFAAFLLIGSACQARTVGLEGVGIDIRQVSQIFRYKSDFLDTTSFSGGLMFPRSSPAQVKGKEYACHDWMPVEQDSRTNDKITRIRASAAGDLLIAMPSAAASGGGWVRLTKGTEPDFYLDQATRSGKFTPDKDSPYWFYQRTYPTPNLWVSLPTNSASTHHSPFVFAEKGELKWENPSPLPKGTVIITTKNPNPVSSTLANPSLLVLPNGDCLAMISNSVDGVGLYRSTDKGLHWSLVKAGFAVNVQSIFEHQGSIYVIGKNTKGAGNTRIYKSSDQGATWTDRIFEGHGGGDAPSHVLIADGRIWKAGFAGNGPGFYSAPVSADLLKESSWTLSAGRWGDIPLANGQKLKAGNESTLLKTKEGKLFNVGKSSVHRPDIGSKNGIVTLQPDLKNLTKVTWDPDYAGPLLSDTGNGKFTAQYDPVSERYWALTSGKNRGKLNLYRAGATRGRIDDFQFVATILDSESSANQGFNYPFMQIDGNDIIFVSRTAWETARGVATRWHDGNLFTFHRIKNFRQLNPPIGK